MKEKEILEGNKLIAEFMEGKLIDGYYDIPHLPVAVIKENCLSYHSSYDWLMPVVEKIEKTCDVTIIIGAAFPYKLFESGRDKNMVAVRDLRRTEMAQSISQTTADNKIDAIWLAVVEFIEWYNQNKSQ